MPTEILISILQAAVRISILILLPALGEVFAERSGVVNLSLEGTMLWGALAGFIANFLTKSVWAAAAASMIGGMLLSLIFASMTVRWRANQVITALVLNILAQGVAVLSYRAIYGTAFTNPPRIPSLTTVPIPVLSQIPVIGPVLFNQPIPSYLVWLLVPSLWFVLHRTHLGLTVRACGEQPFAAASLGASVMRVRFACVLFGGMMAGLGGLLTVLSTGIYDNAMIGGRGFMAVSVVIFGRWDPLTAAVGALVFGLADASQMHLLALGIQVPYQFVQMLPYVLTIVVLWAAMARPGSRAGRPAFLSKHFQLENA